MSGINLDFGDVGGGFEPIPEGIYTIRVDEAEIKPTRAGDSQNINLATSIVEGPYENRKLWANLSLKAAAMWKVQEALEALTGEEWKEDGMNLDVKDLIGMMADVVVEQKPHYDPERAAKGERVNQIAKWMEVGEVPEQGEYGNDDVPF